MLPAFLLGASLEHGSGSAQTPCPVGPPAEVHYSPGENLETIDVALIGEAAKQIDMAAYVLTDSAVVEALRAASARGVKVRIWRDVNMAAKVGDFDVEAQLGGRVWGLDHRADRVARAADDRQDGVIFSRHSKVITARGGVRSGGAEWIAGVSSGS